MGVPTQPTLGQQPEGFKVVVTGGGFAGLTAAIACARQGIAVVLLERGKGPSPYGDAIAFGPNTSRIAFRWGLGEKMWESAAQGLYFNVRDARTGNVVHREEHAKSVEHFGWPVIPGSRSRYHRMMWELAAKTGVELRTGCEAIAYDDSVQGKRPTITLASGEVIEADVVLAADGIKSKAKKAILGFDDPPQSSGYAVFRGFASAESVRDDPETAFLCDGNGHSWIGDDKHAIFATFGPKGQEREMSFAITHADNTDAIEDWNATKKLEDALSCIEGWDPALRKAVSKFPPTVVDWKLSFREPLPRWVSEDGRMTLLGDSAHPFLPTSIQGASQAWEDGATLGICLALVPQTPDGVRLALRVFQDLRYDRVRRAQASGVEQRNKWHKADASNGEANGSDEPPPDVKLEAVAFYAHDAEQHALDGFEAAARRVSADSCYELDVARADDVRRRASLTPEDLARQREMSTVARWFPEANGVSASS